MARPFTNSSSANKAFGVFSGSQNAGNYIHNKKAKSTYCSNTCSPSLKFGSESNRLLFKTSYKMGVYPCLNSINKANLNINLITKLDLTDVHVIQDFSGNTWPSSINTMNTVPDPYLRYNIDPSGNLFGNTICGINNWEKYMVYSNFNITYSLTGTYSITSDSNYNTIITFTGNGTFTITKQNNVIPINYIVVGGGGGGGGGDIASNPGAGGGGGGGVTIGVFNSSVVTYVMTVGAGGLGGDAQGVFGTPASQNGTNGSPSQISGGITISVNGGSYGFASSNLGDGGDSGNVGSTGGAGNNSISPYTGGDGTNGGGGGGGGFYDTVVPQYTPGAGGNGSQSSTSVYSYGTSFGAGGGGGSGRYNIYPSGNAGNSYAGAGGVDVDATDNYGGGGGGGRCGLGIANWTSGSNGGSGRIVLYFNNVFL